MQGAPHSVSSSRIPRLLKKLANKRYRDAYVQSHTKRFLAQQMRALRGNSSQADFGSVLDKPQSVVSRLEDPAYGKWTLQSLFDVASKLNLLVIVRFVDPETFIRITDELGEDAQAPVACTDESLSDARKKLTSITQAEAPSLANQAWLRGIRYSVQIDEAPTSIFFTANKGDDIETPYITILDEQQRLFYVN